MKYLIRHTETNQFLVGTGKHTEWIDDFEEADLYKKKLTKLWWDEEWMELVPVDIVPWREY